ncbi:MAG: LTA synthase family protein, partial [Anaerovoracaceae bacterium]|nr:LTA synthase family protein [Anaerovoracaceae bacterium]
YPYKSVLRDTTMESIPFDLKRLGYSTHAIHNHRAVFYNRNEVFANLGFDDFDALEYMNNVEKTPKNWARDNVLIGEIMEALTSTDTKDYVYTISVEGHGKYPTEQLIQNPEIEVTEAPSQEQKWQYEYYVNMVHSMDNFVKNLTAELEKFDEDVVLVMYGDHLPALDMKEEDMKSGSLYATQYVIWSNFEMEKEDHDVYAYQIGSYVLDRLGIHSGTLVSYNQNYYNDDDYKKNLKALGYDMLYGKRYVYGETEWKASDLKMGLRDIRIDKIVKIGSRYYIKGQNFTQYSYVTLDGEKLDTTFLSPTLLALEQKVDPNAAGELKVSQIEKYDTILSTTE